MSDFLAEEPTLPAVPPDSPPPEEPTTSRIAARMPAALRVRGLPQDPWLGRVLPGGYRLEALLSSGPTERNYCATQQGVGRLATVSLLLHPTLREADARRRFRDSARSASAITHPHVLSVYGFGRTDEGVCFLTTEPQEGVSLRRVLARLGLLPAGRAMAIFAQVAAAVAAAHARGLTHGALRPESILLTQGSGGRDHVKVCEFGCGALGVPVTDGEPAMRRDVEAMGRLLHELCCGQAPRSGPRWRVPMALGTLAPGRRFAPGLEALIRSMMAAEPTQRPKDAGVVLQQLHALAETGPLIIDRDASRAATNGHAQQVDITAPTFLASGRLPVGGDEFTGPVGRVWPLREVGLWSFAALSVGLLTAGVIHGLRPAPPVQTRPPALVAPAPLLPLLLPPPAEIPSTEPAPSGEAAPALSPPQRDPGIPPLRP